MVFKKNFFLLISSILFTLFIIEIFLKFIYFNKADLKQVKPQARYMLFEEGDVFKPYTNFFKYHPNKKILSEVFYKVNDDFIKEYSYEIITNNFGLVQNNNILREKDSILFLGDSFTEGQGYSAWINKFGGQFKKFQIINGGLLGTGPKQFEHLESHISESFRISKVVVLYLGDDLRRSIFNFNKKNIECLSNFEKCEGNENFYGFPLRVNEPSQFLEKLEKFRTEYFKKRVTFKTVRRDIKSFFLELYIIKIPKNFLKNKFYKSKNDKILNNLSAFSNLINKYNDNIIFIQLKQKEEILYGKRYETIYAEEFIKSKTNNHFECNFNDELSNFYKIDGHPNKKGYDALYECVLNIINLNL